jgi:monofunctional chorismate mutase
MQQPAGSHETIDRPPAASAWGSPANTLDRPIVAIQGELGSFSDEAVTRYWTGRGVALPQIDCARVVTAVRSGRATHGMLAMENSIAGIVPEAHAALAASPDIAVIGEIVVPIVQCLMAPRGATLDSVRAVHSHPIALRQCATFLAANPHLEPRDAYDTAGAARDVSARGDIRHAAIAGRAAAKRYGLELLAEDVGDRPRNETRFAVITRRSDGAQHRMAVATSSAAAMAALRGATTVRADETLLIHDATSELLAELLTRNDLTPDRVISAIFTMTADLRSEFPARAARDLGFHDVPMISAVEVNVPGSLARCIRVLLHVTGPVAPPRGRSVYLHGAAALRPDIAGTTTV